MGSVGRGRQIGWDLWAGVGVVVGVAVDVAVDVAVFGLRRTDRVGSMGRGGCCEGPSISEGLELQYIDTKLEGGGGMELRLRA